MPAAAGGDHLRRGAAAGSLKIKGSDGGVHTDARSWRTGRWSNSLDSSVCCNWAWTSAGRATAWMWRSCSPICCLPSEHLMSAHWGYLAAITGLDLPPYGRRGPKRVEGQMEVLYHFCRGRRSDPAGPSPAIQAPAVPSICGLIPSATLYERELIEMFGVSAGRHAQYRAPVSAG